MDFNVMGYDLDKQQIEIVKDKSQYLLVIAGAGSGKSLTIIAKIKYLLLNKYLTPDELLCISFTNNSTKSLNEKIKKELNVDIDSYTFHKLAIKVTNNNYDICDNNLLDDIIHKFLYIDIFNNELLMKYILKYYNQYNKRNIKKQYTSLINNNKLYALEKLISSFIRLFKCGGYEIKDFNLFFQEIKHTYNYSKYKKEKIFLLIAFNIYLIYQKYLNDNNEVDFDELIIKATEYVQKKGFYKNLKYIIIDEYQDTSFIRFNLIKTISLKTNAKVMAVGDDYQSIYRFTGCDISLFTNFNKFFNNAKILKIETTYRNSMELITIASRFIMKNKKQIYKQLYSNKHLDKPIIFVKEKLFYQLLDSLQGKVLILGRNNNDINKYDIKKYNNVSYMTIHKAKGLEEENVIIINLIDDIMGFPCKIKNDSILRLVTADDDYYPYSEERRLMYVALTRTKNKVYLIVPNNKKSIFIKQLKRLIR